MKLYAFNFTQLYDLQCSVAGKKSFSQSVLWSRSKWSKLNVWWAIVYCTYRNTVQKSFTNEFVHYVNVYDIGTHFCYPSVSFKCESEQFEQHFGLVSENCSADYSICLAWHLHLCKSGKVYKFCVHLFIINACLKQVT